MPVMQILNALEEEAFESPPYFTSIERKKFFALPLSLQESFGGFRTSTNKVCFLGAFGYFKARRKFFGKQFRTPDIEFVATRFDLEPSNVETTAYDKQTALRHQQTILDALLEKEDAPQTEEPPKVQRYRLTLLKKFQHSTKPAKIKANISDLQLLRSLSSTIEPTLTALGLTDAGLRYYANSVIKAEIFQVSRRAAPDRYLHLLAFIAYQTFKLHDLLIDGFLQSVQSTINTTAREHKELYYTSRIERRQTLNEIIAGIIGLGCDIGPGKIARVSKHLNESEMETTINRYFSLPNIQAANDRILRALDRLDLPNIYRRDADKLHTSSDGQKFEVAVESLNANYSFKYFGQARGVTVYSFIDERHFLFHSTVISSAEREAAYVIDGLLHNEVVKSDIHSTDTHGYSEIIFAVTHL